MLLHAILLLLSPLSAADDPSGTFWMPPQVSTTAHQVDWVFYFVFWVSLFFFLLIATLLVIFVIKYRAREGGPEEESPSHNTALEIVWSVIPIIIVTFIFYFGFTGYMDLGVPPKNAYEVQVTGQKWNWLFTYPNGHVSEDLHVPVDRPVQLVMTSEDVIHSLFIPAFRVKMDAVPGRYSKLWFTATKPGKYEALCAEYCGTKHSDMSAWVVVHPAPEFDHWLIEASNFLDKLPPAEAGKKLYQLRGCAQCHSTDGTASVGPSFYRIFGMERPLESGARVTVDENYLRESIVDPQAKVTQGFQPVMPTFRGKLSDRELTVIIDFIKSLKNQGE